MPRKQRTTTFPKVPLALPELQSEVSAINEHIEREIKDLEERLATLRNEASTPREPDDVPGRTPDGRFLPSRTLAYDLLGIAERSRLADLPGEEHSPTEYSVPDAAEYVRSIISQTLDRVLYTAARVAAAHQQTRVPVANEQGEFVDSIASGIVQHLGVNAYDAPHFLRVLHRSLAEVLIQAPIPYEWATLRYDKLQLELSVSPAASQPERTDEPATFYRDLSEL